MSDSKALSEDELALLLLKAKTMVQYIFPDSARFPAADNPLTATVFTALYHEALKPDSQIKLDLTELEELG